MRIFLLKLLLFVILMISFVSSSAAADFPWEFNRDYTYEFVQNGVRLGTEIFSIKRARARGEEVYLIEETLDLASGKYYERGKGKLYAKITGRPMYYEKEWSANIPGFPVGSGDFKAVYNFGARIVSVKIQKFDKTTFSGNIELPETDFYGFDNNFIGKLALISVLENAPGKSNSSFTAFHFDSQQMTSFELKPLFLERTLYKNKSINVKKMDFSISGINGGNLMITQDGMLIGFSLPGDNLQINLLNK